MGALAFEDMGLRPEILRAIDSMGFKEASPIQSEAIPVMMSGYDLIGQAQTGTGKTAALGIPVLEKIDPDLKSLQAIILCPTRELAIQITDELRRLARYMHAIKILPVYGGQEIIKQIRPLRSGVQLIVGTPGRVMDHMRRNTIKMDDVHTVVMDEADEMLNMGFREDMETILEGVTGEHQTVMFSATMSSVIKDIARRFQQDAKIIKIQKKELTTENIEQLYYEVKPNEKEEVLSRLVDMYQPKRSVVFCNTKKKVDLLVNELLSRGYGVAALHGDLKQAQRDRVMQGFRNGSTNILIATDVAARGIDVDDVEAVFNFDLPMDEEYYVHRIGRTGRAGRKGRAFTFVTKREKYKLKTIERYCKTIINPANIPTAKDVANRKMELIFEEITDVLENEELKTFRKAIKRNLFDTEFEALDIAAALLFLNTKKTESQKEDSSRSSYDGSGNFGDTGAVDEGMVRLFVNIGKKNKAKVGDLVGAFAGESGIPGKEIGAIDMHEGYSFVEVPIEHAHKVITSMNQASIKGKTVAVEPASTKRF